MPTQTLTPTYLGMGGKETGVYRIDTSAFRQSASVWILIEDDHVVSGGRGAASGFDLDFMYWSNTLTNNPAQVPTNSLNSDTFKLAVVDADISFRGGYQQPTLATDPAYWNNGKLVGSNSSSSINFSSTTFWQMDGDSSSPVGGLSLGEGGAVLVRWTPTATALNQYLYFGDIGGGNDGVTVTISDQPLSLAVTGRMLLKGTDADDTIRLGEGLNLDLGAGKDRLEGGNGNDNLATAAGDDILVGGAGNDVLDGGTGRDTAIFSGKWSASTIVRGSTAIFVTNAADGTDTLSNIERIRFDDGVVLTDLGNNGPTAYRLYQAALGRAPDEGGLRVQAGALDGGTSALQLAQNFLGAAEFTARFGTAQSNSDFATAMYTNILGRAPDAAGLKVQVDALNAGLSRAQLLLNFSEAAENVQLTGAATKNGLFSPFPDSSYDG